MTTVCGVGLHTKEERGDEHYITPLGATESLIAIESHNFPKGKIWEPACGNGKGIVIPMRRLGFDVVASDLRKRRCPDSYKANFLEEQKTPGGVSAIITNPPFSLAQAFVERALDHCGYVAYLLRTNFLEGFKRKPWFENSPLARVYVASRRLPMMHREGWKGKKAGSAVCHSWFVWDKRHKGEPVIRWFDYKDLPARIGTVPANDNYQCDLEEAIARVA
jgi:hypothetical protein